MALTPLRVVVGILSDRVGRVLISQRLPGTHMAGFWEFPGGKQQPGEDLADTVRREVKEDTGLRVRVDSPYCQVNHGYTHFKITLTAFRCEWIKGREKPLATDELRWVGLDQLDEYPFPKANIKVLEAVRDYERMQGKAS